MEEWTDIQKIMRDLSVAQGSVVPSDVDGTLPGQKPLMVNCDEETEQEYYQRFTCDGEFDAPDLLQIKQMLDMVQSQNGSDDDRGDGIVQISKLNAQASEFIPKVPDEIGDGDSVSKVIKPKQKVQRNVAVMSLLQAISDDKDPPKMHRHEPIILRKPDDFICRTPSNAQITDNETQKKIDASCKSSKDNSKKEYKLDIKPESSPIKKEKWRPCIAPIAPSSMFKRKSVIKKTKPAEVPQVSTSNFQKQYVPSEKAAEYYQKFMKQAELRETIQEDIWSRAEKEMKDLDDKRKLKFETCLSPSNSCTSSTSKEDSNNKIGIEGVWLPRHRHELSEHCVVCDVLCEKETKTVSSDPQLVSCEKEATALPSASQLVFCEKVSTTLPSASPLVLCEKETTIVPSTSQLVVCKEETPSVSQLVMCEDERSIVPSAPPLDMFESDASCII